MSNGSSSTSETSAREMIERLRVPTGGSHTHRPLSDVLRDLHIGSVERVLLWLSKTDYYVLWLSTFSARRTLGGLGMMVIFTSLLAFFSSLYALKSTLVSPDTPLQWPITLALAALYSFGIMIIDREIVGAVSRKSLYIRFFFAIFIAIAVSYPVKLKFFEGRIQLEINRMVDEKNAAKLKRIDDLKQTGEPERRQQREVIQRQIASLDKEIGVLDREINREANIVECGPKCQAFRKQKEGVEQRRAKAAADLAALSRPEALPENIRKEIEGLDQEVKDEHKISYDFLTKWEALGRIKKASEYDYDIMSAFMFLFFMMLEMVPLGLKWSLGKTEYHYYLEARENINNQKIISIHNLFMQAMQRDPQAVLDLVPLEITDIIAAAIEDEAKSGSTPPGYSTLGAILRMRGGRGPSGEEGGPGGGGQAERRGPGSGSSRSSESGGGGTIPSGVGGLTPGGPRSPEETADEPSPQH